MLRIVSMYIVVMLAPPLSAMATFADPPLSSQSLTQLEQQQQEIDTKLNQLAHFSLRSGIGSIGFRSMWHKTATQPEWIEIQLDQAYLLDEIMLIPAIRRDTQQGFQADGFPAKFRILAGTADHPSGTVLGTYRSSDGILPRVAPLIIPAQGITASWVRIEATRLSQRALDKHYVFQLSEVLLFSGEENVALRQTVKVSSSHPEPSNSSWNEHFLVDGHTPYLMDAAQGAQSVAYVSPHGTLPTLSLDLEAEYPLSRIHLHALDQSDTVPQSFAGDLGIPKLLRIEGAKRPDFSDATLLLETQMNSVNNTGPIMMWRIPETTCRYIRIFNAAPDAQYAVPSTFRIGFAEIELFSADRNVARGKTVTITPPTAGFNTTRLPSALTDGRNLYGNILPIKSWLNELAQRHDLETKRPLVMEELSLRYARQKTNLNRVSWLAVLLAAGIGFTILIDRNLHLRKQTRIKERFAADLHDELGANLHTIGLLIDLARENIDSRAELIELLERSRVFSERSGSAARYCTNILEANGLCEELVDEMKRSAARLLADLHYAIRFEGEEILKQLKPRKRIDLFFFYKECLTNIIRHSGATEVDTTLMADRKQLVLIVSDNGYGLNNGIPPSLKRRARLLGGQVLAKNNEGGGTRITLKLKIRRRLHLSQKSTV